MTDKKVSALTDGTTANATDRIPVARSPFGSGDNAYITPAYLDTYMASTTKTLSNKTLAAPTLTGTVTLTGGTVNGTVLDISQTWGGTGTYTGLKYNVTDSGPANAASLLMDLQVTNVSKLSVSKNGLVTSAGTGFSGSGNGGAFSWAGGVIGNSSTTPFFQSAGSSMWFGTGGNTPIIFSALSGTNVSIDLVSDTGRLRLGGSSDTILARDAANTLGLRITGTTASVFNVYREADSGLTATSYATIDAGKTTANTLILGSMKVGSPANALTKLQINVDGTSKADYGVSSASQWTFAGTTNVGALNIGAAGYLVWISRGSINANADGVYAWMNAAGNDFDRLQFGGTTSSFPSLKRSSTALYARLADDSAYAPFSAELVTVAAGTATPAGGSTAGRLLMGTTAGFGVYYGSGAPTVSAAQGSIYLRSDGSSTSTRLYVNTDGSTTWTAVTTAT